MPAFRTEDFSSPVSAAPRGAWSLRPPPRPEVRPLSALLSDARALDGSAYSFDQVLAGQLRERRQRFPGSAPFEINHAQRFFWCDGLNGILVSSGKRSDLTLQQAVVQLCAGERHRVKDSTIAAAFAPSAAEVQRGGEPIRRCEFGRCETRQLPAPLRSPS